MFDFESWKKSAEAHIDVAIEDLRKNCGCDTVQIIVTCHDDELGLTSAFRRGRGNWYARIGAVEQMLEIESGENIQVGANIMMPKNED